MKKFASTSEPVFFKQNIQSDTTNYRDINKEEMY